ncbi:MAG: DUF4159 domain-containing protein, partial [Rhodobacteraceae bacterium]|nr:DUF4159 domain-containing protein [Paracoccaceae bacterium]
ATAQPRAPSIEAAQNITLAFVKTGHPMVDQTSEAGLHGLYQNADRVVALNVMGAKQELRPMVWPAGVSVQTMAGAIKAIELRAGFLIAALVLLLADLVASLVRAGRLSLRSAGARAAAGALALVATSMGAPHHATAQPRAPSIEAAQNITLAFVKTGHPRVDQTSEAGLHGLSRILARRTAVEPSPPVAIDLQRDDIALYPLLYWPLTPDHPLPDAAAYERLNTYLRTGGMIVFDTRDADIASSSAFSTPNARKLQQLTAALDIPALEIIPEDHVLTRSFYLLQDFPGRYNSRAVWVETSRKTTTQTEAQPFRTLNDGVSPVVIGGNDWAAAWALDAQGNAMSAMGSYRFGQHQREMAYRFGVNLIMYVLMGNYKSDQIHVPALLERLGP